MNVLSWIQTSAVLGSNTPPVVILYDLLLSFVLSQFVAWMYAWTHRGMSYSRNLLHSLVLLSMIVTAVMLVVGDSVARAFGLVGALAIIRFRTVVRDARDTTFIFLALAVGIAVGAHHYGVAVVGAGAVSLVAALLQVTGFGTRFADTGVLRVRGVGGLGQALDGALTEWCRTFELTALRETGAGDAEYSYEIRLWHPGERDQLLAALRNLPGAGTVTLAIEETAEEW